MTLKIKNIQTFKVNNKKQNKTKQKNNQKKNNLFKVALLPSSLPAQNYK